MSQLPAEDPYDRGSLADRSFQYVRSNPALRIALVVTALDHFGAIALVLLDRIPADTAGLLALFSVLAWFFAVCMPLMNRAVRGHLGAPESHYWGEVVEMFGRVVVCVQAVLYTTALVLYAFTPGL